MGATSDDAETLCKIARSARHFAERNGLKTEVIDSSQSEIGGVKHLAAEIYPCQEAGLVKVGCAGQESALRFKNQM